MEHGRNKNIEFQFRVFVAHAQKINSQVVRMNDGKKVFFSFFKVLVCVECWDDQSNCIFYDATSVTPSHSLRIEILLYWNLMIIN